MTFTQPSLRLREKIQATLPLLTSMESGDDDDNTARQRVERRFQMVIWTTAAVIPGAHDGSIPLIELNPTSITKLDKIVDGVRDTLRKLDSVQSYISHIDDVLDDLNNHLSEYVDSSEDESPAVRSALYMMSTELDNRIVILRSREAAEDAAEDSAKRASALLGITSKSAENAQEAAGYAQEAAGVSAEASLASTFGKYARKKELLAAGWQWFTILILVSIVLVAIEYALHGATTMHWTEEVKRLAIAVPLFTLAALTNHRSGEYRRSAQWSRELEILLKTIDGYTGPMSKDHRDLLKMVFGMRLFSSKPVTTPEDQGERPLDLMGTLTQGFGDTALTRQMTNGH